VRKKYTRVREKYTRVREKEYASEGESNPTINEGDGREGKGKQRGLLKTAHLIQFQNEKHWQP
jgi:hypothetical protein